MIRRNMKMAIMEACIGFPAISIASQLLEKQRLLAQQDMKAGIIFGDKRSEMLKNTFVIGWDRGKIGSPTSRLAVTAKLA